jgi:hypothetical protein
MVRDLSCGQPERRVGVGEQPGLDNAGKHGDYKPLTPWELDALIGIILRQQTRF